MAAGRSCWIDGMIYLHVAGVGNIWAANPLFSSPCLTGDTPGQELEVNLTKTALGGLKKKS